MPGKNLNLIKDVESSGEYKVLGEYKNNKTKMEIIHTKCGNHFFMRLNDFQQGHRCPYCFAKPKKTTESYGKLVKEKTNGEYELVSEYVNDETAVHIKHVPCGRVTTIKPATFRNCGYSACSFCNNPFRKTLDDFKDRVKELEGEEYTVLDDIYINCKIPIKMRHEKCGNEFKISRQNFLNGSRCPFCKASSNAELRIAKFLTENKIRFIKEFKFPDCKDINPLPFDFAIFKKENQSNVPDLLIEYDGEQHFKIRKSSKIFNSEERLKKIQYHDKLKNEYCERNNIPLLRIHYNSYKSLNNKLKKELKTFIDYPLVE